MSETVQERAARLQRESMIVDAHFDLAMDLLYKWERGKKHPLLPWLERFRKGGFGLVVSSLFVSGSFLPEMGLRRALDQLAVLVREIRNTEGITLCRTMEDIERARREGEVGILLSFEGLDPIGNDLNLLDIFHDLGVRAAGIVWSRRNYAGDGCFFSPKREGKKGGLTPFGVEAVQRAQELGMVIDVSHLNDEGFWDVMDIAKGPLIASHSNCRSLAHTMRNLTDEQIRALAEKGGVMGMNAISCFVREDHETRRAIPADLAAHVEHIANLVGVDHVGLGFDFCDGFENYLTLEDDIKTYDVIAGHENVCDFTVALLERGFNDEEMRKILGGNFLRVFGSWLGK